MRYLIRFLSQGAAGSVEHYDKIVDDPTITIGRATDQVLHLKDKRARLQHARIEVRNGDVHISTRALAGVTVNGRSQRDAKLRTGDVIEVGSNILTIIEAPPGFDFAFTFELSPDATSDELTSQFGSLRLSQVAWSKRRLSWALAIIVIVLALIIPASGLLHPTAADILRNTVLLPDDGLWLAGPVHNKHSKSSTQCQHCHTQAFNRVKDVACLECHQTDRHVNSTATEAILGEQRCASCHLEHNEPPELVKQHQNLCADCHADLPAGVELAAATDFLKQHPDLQPSLLRPPLANDGDAEWTVQRIALDDPRLIDRSRLKFDHSVHLDADGLTTPDDRRVLVCTDCHRVETGGARMIPISMDEHCSGCHTLNFDADDPDREVPHGEPEKVLQILIEYYSARLLGDDPQATGRRLRRPGQALTRADRDRVAGEARKKAMAVAQDIFERTTCANCHEVSSTGEGGAAPWRVEAVKLTQEFYPRAVFSHQAHDTEAVDCGLCHAAADSESSADVLMPGIDTCRECHGSAVARRNHSGQIASTCIMCHRFHTPDKGSFP
ncbi:MAG: FHA domain-containing protein [Gammaproteobacteria bacterium]|nr:FHA domain-containing protein [Gammaproteobacteria bacterium]